MKDLSSGKGVVIGISVLFVALVIGVGLFHRSARQESEVLSASAVLSPTLGPEVFENNTQTKQVTSTPTQPNTTTSPTKESVSPTVAIGGLSGSPTTKPTQMKIEGDDSKQTSSDPTKGPTPTGQMVHAVGKVSMHGKTVEYYVDFPSSGGTMSGRGGGDCTGNIRGTFFAGNKVASGSLDGQCREDGEEIEVTGTYAGKIYLTVGSGYGTWEGERVDTGEVFEGEWELAFPPVK